MIASLRQDARPVGSVGAWAKAARQDTTNGRLAGKAYQRGMFRLALVLRAKSAKTRAEARAWLRAEAQAWLRRVERIWLRSDERAVRLAELSGPLSLRNDDGPPGLCELVVCNVGFAGPPTMAAVSEAPVISP